jgi:hypothetical protein
VHELLDGVASERLLGLLDMRVEVAEHAFEDGVEDPLDGAAAARLDR